MSRQATKEHYIYVNINEQTVALFLIADTIRISKYLLFLLYETFGNDLFLMFRMFYKAGMLPELSEFRLSRCLRHAETIVPILLGHEGIVLNQTQTRAYQIVNPYLYETKLRIPEDQEVLYDI